MTAKPYTINRPSTANRPAQATSKATTKTGRKLTDEQIAASQARRDYLKNLSAPIQIVRSPDGSAALAFMPEDQARIFEAFRNKDRFPTVNSCLEFLYRMKTGQNVFKTFAGWREEGYRVSKGSSGFPVWGTPREIKPGCTDAPRTMAGEDSDGEETGGREWFPISYLFNESQVEEIIGEFPGAIQIAARFPSTEREEAARAIAAHLNAQEPGQGDAAVKHLRSIGIL